MYKICILIAGLCVLAFAEECRIGSTPQSDWYFFSHKDKKYPTGTRTNRATAAGFWKATGRDKVIYSSFSKIGMRKTLVFYKGRAPRGQKSDWIMHEYRLDDATHDSSVRKSSSITPILDHRPLDLIESFSILLILLHDNAKSRQII